MKKAILMAAVAALFVGMLAVPASATASNSVVVFHGEAIVSPGLLVPGLGGKVNNGTWSFTSDPSGHLGGATNPGVLCESTLGSCAIQVTGGLLRPVAGIGAACGISHGKNGAGAVHAPVPGTDGHLAVEHIGWVTSAGGTLPVTGSHANGPVVGVVQAQGALPCVQGGATNFTVVGVVAAL